MSRLALRASVVTSWTGYVSLRSGEAEKSPTSAVVVYFFRTLLAASDETRHVAFGVMHPAVRGPNNTRATRGDTRVAR
jgi:hypothetical protein